MKNATAKSSNAAEQGFMLLGLIVTVFLILLVLGVAAPRLAKSLRRDREVEAVHRGRQYVRAIRQYYIKTGHYPGSIEQLEKTNNIRFLRQRYVDPMTGKPDWRLIHVGEAKTTVKGFFGKPLAGITGASGGGLGTGSAIGAGNSVGAGTIGTTGSNTSTGFGSSTNSGSSFGSSGSSFGSGSSSSGSSFGSSGSSFGSSGSSGSSFGSSSSSFGSNTGGTGTGSTTPAGSGTSSSFGPSSGSPGTSNGIASQSATTFSGGGAPIMGVSSVAQGASILVVNEQTTYPTWEFLYDPRSEQLKAKSTGLGTGVSSSGSNSSFGSSNSSFGSSSSGFGSSPSGSVMGTTSSPGTTTPSTPTSPTSPPLQ